MAAAKPIILYDIHNIGDATMSASSAASGSPIENLFDHRTFTLWEPTSS
ncbi:hypothetical protein LCGC14_2874890, partial [marine sediment metagenome]